jgi:hypothetical protein
MSALRIHNWRYLSLLVVLTCACSGPSAPREAGPSATQSPYGARFYLVGPRGTRATDPSLRALSPGFGVAITEEVMLGSERMGRTRLGRLLPMRDLEPVTPSTFRGMSLVASKIDFAWLGVHEAYVWPRPEVRGKPRSLKRLHDLVRLREQSGPEGFQAVEGGWMEKSVLRIPSLSARPTQVGSGEAWIDVELASQTLVAYQGDRPVFATLVSSGRGRPGSPFATPVGVHRIVNKLLAATMDNLEHTEVVPFSYEDVPYTQYIGRVALHGAFWHDFGVL